MSAVEHVQPASSDAAASPGRRLAEARAAHNLSQADVARQLKLSVSQVEALESGLYHQLPGAIFVRGFIRNYARLVKLDPEQLVQSLGDNVPAAKPRPEPSPSQDIPFPGKGRPRWAAWVAPAALVVTLLAVYEFLWNEPYAPPAAAPAPVASGPQAPRPGSQPGAAVTASRPAAPETEGTSAAAKAPAAEPAPGAQSAAVVGAGSEAAPAPALRRGERQVKLAFDQECWIEIRDRNEKVIFSQLNRPGTQQSVSGMPPFSVVVGNAHGVRMTYDDKPVDLAPHTKIDVARLILP